MSRARSVLAVVAHFRGDFHSARMHWLRAAESPVDTSSFVGSAALAAAYGGDTPAPLDSCSTRPRRTRDVWLT